MSYSCLLFLNNELPDYVMTEVDGEIIRYPPNYPLEEGHEGWWDRCFVNNPVGLPKHHYGFGFPSYDHSIKTYLEQRDPGWYSRTLKSARIHKEYLKKLIEITEEGPLYIRLYVDHVLTEKDLENVIEINLNEIDFTEGNEPEEFDLGINRFYRFVCK